MTTTTVIVEILIIGFFATIWILLFCLHLSIFNLQGAKDFISGASQHSTELFIASTAFFYILGLIMNSLSHKLTNKFAQNQYRDFMIKGKNYEIIRATVAEKGSEETIRNLTLYLSFVRLARSGMINFILISIALALFGRTFAGPAVISLLVSLGCLMIWRGYFRYYYKRMKYAYLVIAGLDSELPELSDLPAPRNLKQTVAGSMDDGTDTLTKVIS